VFSQDLGLPGSYGSQSTTSPSEAAANRFKVEKGKLIKDCETLVDAWKPQVSTYSDIQKRIAREEAMSRIFFAFGGGEVPSFSLRVPFVLLTCLSCRKVANETFSQSKPSRGLAMRPTASTATSTASSPPPTRSKRRGIGLTKARLLHYSPWVLYLLNLIFRDAS